MDPRAGLVVVVWVTGGLLWQAVGTTPLAAQERVSLAEVARQEQARRKNIKAPAKVLTNEDLPPVPLASPVPPPPPAADQVTDPSPATPSVPATEEKAEGPAKDQAYWSKRMMDLQTAISRNETFAVALQSRINALANEYTNQSDGVRQGAIAVERQKTIAELNRLNQEIASGKTAVADLQEEARRSGVPPGWLR